MSLAWRSVARTDTGHVRAHNEDSLVDRPGIGLWAVADGMGGHHAGERASGLLKQALDALPGGGEPKAFLAAVRGAIETVHGTLHAEAATTGVSGSTVVAFLACGGRYACCWAGDSRLYRLRHGRLERLTRDHSLVEELVAAGTLTPEQARTHPLSNRLTRAVGVGDRLELDLAQGRLADADRYLLSSDGLHGVLPEPELHRLLATPDLQAAADALLAASLAAGAPDNVTLVVVSVETGLDRTLPG